MITGGTRKLAAILFTDIVGYSAQSHQDEPAALRNLSEHRTLVRPLIAEFRGREVKTIGDAFLVEFGSALDAVLCAIRIQSVHQERNASRPKNEWVRLRVGIHMGDVLMSEGDVYGDGVNIAARLLYLAKPGEICVSRPVYDQVRSHISDPVLPIGPKRLKNISGPVEAFLIGAEKRSTSERTFSRAAVLIQRRSVFAALFFAIALGLWISVRMITRVSRFPATESQNAERIAVLPFESISPAADDAYLADGLTDEIISGLSNIRGLRVLARSSSAPYRDRRAPVVEIAQDLKVGSVVEGSVQRVGEALRIRVKLMDARTEESLWSHEFDGSVQNVFDIQKRIAIKIAGQFRGRALASVDSVTARGALGPKSDAYLIFLRGRYFMAKRTREGLLRAVTEFKKAIDSDPRFAPAYALLGSTYGLLGYYGYMSPNEAVHEEASYAEQALKLDPDSSAAWVALAEKQAHLDLDVKAADASFRRAISGAVSFSSAHQWYGEFLIELGKFNEARAELREALDLDPLSLMVNTASGLPDFYDHQYDAAIRRFRAALDLDPDFILAHFWIGRAYTEAGKWDLALASLKRAVQLSRGEPMMNAALARAYALSGNAQEARAILGELVTDSKGHYVSPYDLALVYAALGERENLAASLEASYTERSSHMGYLRVDPGFDRVRSDSRLAAILQKLTAP